MLYKSLLAVIFALYMVYGQEDLAADDGASDEMSISSTATGLEASDSGEMSATDSSDDDDNDFGSDESSEESFEVSSTGEGESGDDEESASMEEDIDDEDPSDDGTIDADTSDDSVEDDCLGLTQNQCQEEAAEDGDAECAFNAQTSECYSIVRRAGVHGSGDYDDGFIAAQEAAKEEANELYTVVGVLGGIIGALIIVIAGGGYYFYQKSQKIHTETSTLEMMDTGSMGQTNFVNNDTSPMIVQE